MKPIIPLTLLLLLSATPRLLSQTIGEERGKAIFVTENIDHVRTSPIRNVSGIAATVGGTYSRSGRTDELDHDIQFQKIKIKAVIYVKFGIK